MGLKTGTKENFGQKYFQFQQIFFHSRLSTSIVYIALYLLFCRKVYFFSVILFKLDQCYKNMFGRGSRHSSVDSSVPTTLGSSPKHTIYAF